MPPRDRRCARHPDRLVMDVSDRDVAMTGLGVSAVKGEVASERADADLPVMGNLIGSHADGFLTRRRDRELTAGKAEVQSRSVADIVGRVGRSARRYGHGSGHERCGQERRSADRYGLTSCGAGEYGREWFSVDAYRGRSNPTPQAWCGAFDCIKLANTHGATPFELNAVTPGCCSTRPMIVAEPVSMQLKLDQTR